MKARITFFIGAIVVLINTLQIIISYDPLRFIGLGLGLLFMYWGLRVGWTQYRNLTVIVGHIAIVTGSLVTAFAIYQIPFLNTAPTLLQVLDLPLFWGIFIIWGGNCMITHGYCSCAIRMHDFNNASQIQAKPEKN